MKNVKCYNYKTTDSGLKWFLFDYLKLVKAGEKTDVNVEEIFKSIISNKTNCYDNVIEEMFYIKCKELIDKNFIIEECNIEINGREE